MSSLEIGSLSATGTEKSIPSLDNAATHGAVIMWRSYEYLGNTFFIILRFLSFAAFTTLYSVGAERNLTALLSIFVRKDVFTFAPFAYITVTPQGIAVLLLLLKSVSVGANRKNLTPRSL